MGNIPTIPLLLQDKDKLEALIEQLRQYDQTGIPASKPSTKNNSSIQDAIKDSDEANICNISNNCATNNCNPALHCNSSGNIYFLEKHWGDIVSDVNVSNVALLFCLS